MPHLDCGHIIHKQSNNVSFSDKIESIQYNAVLAITGAIKDTSKETLSGNIKGQNKRWLRRLCYTFTAFIIHLKSNKQVCLDVRRH